MSIIFSLAKTVLRFFGNSDYDDGYDDYDHDDGCEDVDGYDHDDGFDHDDGHDHNDDHDITFTGNDNSSEIASVEREIRSAKGDIDYYSRECRTNATWAESYARDGKISTSESYYQSLRNAQGKLSDAQNRLESLQNKLSRLKSH